MTPYQLPLAIVLGLTIGSFLNVLIYRIPIGKKFWEGRSYCPGCEAPIKWYQNIPVLSYLALRGKCASCKMNIPIRYLLVELLNGVTWTYFVWQYGLTVEGMVFCFLSSALITIFFIDYDHQIIPDVITLPGMVLGIVVALYPGGLTIVQSLIGLLVGGGSLYLIAMLGDWLFKKESMGGGDIKMAAMLGAFLGWQQVLFVFMASAVIGLVISLAIMAFSSKLREQRVVPFGPFIAIAAMLSILWGEQIVSFYVNNFLMPG